MHLAQAAFVGTLGLAVFVLNPAACDPGFQYGEEELRAAVEGTWQVTIEPASGPASTFTVRLEQATTVSRSTPEDTSLVRTATACGNRTFVRGAEACVSSTEMLLQGQVLDGADSLRAVAVKGVLWVPSLIFSQGQLWLAVGPHTLSGTLSSAGEASSLQTGTAGDKVSLTRIAR